MLPSPSNASDQPPRKSSEQQLNRACEACRLSKVRCLVNPGSGSLQCQRCAKANRQCVFAPPAKRRQRKRTDVRVAELEREVKQLHSLLKPTHSTISPVEVSDQESLDEEDEQSDGERESPGYPQSHESTTTPATANVSDRPNIADWPNVQNQEDCGPPRDLLGPSENDIIDRGVITKELAEELLNIYRDELIQEYPGVIIPKAWTAEQLRSKKPALFHAVMAAASHSKGATLSNKLHEEVVYLYARSLFIKGEKSLQYIQALFVTVSYYTPPNTPAQLQIYQYGNMAASMALELGLASKPRTHEQLPKRAIRSLQRISSADELLENCRTILALYTLTAGFSMRLRRPNILLFNSWMEECQTLLAKSPILEDRRIVAWLRLQRIADEAYTAFGFDDASTSFTLSELRLQAILRIFERRMQEWRKSIPEEVMSMTLQIEYHQNMMSMWEFAMDGGRYDAPEFKNRHLTLPALDDDSIQPETLLSRSALQTNATIMCISAAHSVLDCFLQITVEKLQKAPGVVFVRAIYGLVALMKADYAIGTDAEGMGEVLDSKTLKVSYYMDTVLKMTADAIGPQNCRIPSHWNYVLKQKLKSWHDDYQQWRRDGGHLKRNAKAQKEVPPTTTRTEMLPATTPSTYALRQESAPAAPPLPTRSSVTAAPLRQTPQQQPLPNFNPNSIFPWSTPNCPFPATTADHNMADNANAYGPDMTDFSAAFQNGDLYLWNDISDNFGGWIPQGGNLYSDLQFSGMGGQGM